MQRHAFEVQLAATEEFAADPGRGGPGRDHRAEPARLRRARSAPTSGRSPRLAGQLANARHLELDWAGHLPSMERPDVVTALLADSWSRVGAQRREGDHARTRQGAQRPVPAGAYGPHPDGRGNSLNLIVWFVITPSRPARCSLSEAEEGHAIGSAR